jgi:hypothetical protein
MNWPTMNANVDPVTRSRLQIGIAALGSIGILTPFLPFTSSTSPLRVIVFLPSTTSLDYAPIALPFFLAILILIAHARVIVAGRFSRTEVIIAYGSSIIMAFATLAFTIRALISGPPSASAWPILALPWITIAFGIALVRWCRRRSLPSALAALTAMQCAYIANAFFCLAAFWPHWQAGAFVTAVTVAIYAAHVALVLVSTNKVRVVAVRQ